MRQGLMENTLRREGDVPEVRQQVREVDVKLDTSVSNIRNDVKHAIALCSATTKSELQTEMSSRTKEMERRINGKLVGNALPLTCCYAVNFLHRIKV